MTTSVTPPMTVPSSALPAALVECTHEATASTFEAICGQAPIYLGERDQVMPTAAVVGIISFVGDYIWSVMLGIPKDTSPALALTFIGAEVGFEDPDMGDVVGELTNVLAGHAVARLDEMGIQAEMSLPTVVRGTDLDLMLPGEVPSSFTCFTLPEGPFWVRVAKAGGDRQLTRRPGH